MANRQAITTIRSTSISSSSSFPSRSRLVHSSSPNRATLLAAGALTTAEPEEITLPPIFDIFDVPANLAESSELIRSTLKTRRPHEVEPSPSRQNFRSSLPRPPPSTLPPPIIFDGPARPRNIPLAFQRRVEQALDSVPASTTQARRHHTPSTLPTASEPTIKMFEGPARLAPYSHRRPHHQERVGNQLVFLGVVTAVGGAAFLTHDNFSISH